MVASKCPACDAFLDAASSINKKHALPSPGDYSICFYCTTFVRYGPNMELIELTSTDFHKLSQEMQDELFQLRRAIHYVFAKKVKNEEKTQLQAGNAENANSTDSQAQQTEERMI